MNTMQIIPEHFSNLPVEIIEIDGKRWLRAEDVGRCLGYTEDNARKGVMKLFERHQDEFESLDSTVVKLTTVDGKLRDVRIFSQSGCMLLGMFASTPRAKQFRLWAKDALVSVMSRTLPQPPLRRSRVKITRTIEREVLEYFAVGYVQAEIARAMGISTSVVNQLIHAKYRFPADAGEDETSDELIALVAERCREYEIERCIKEQQRIARLYLADATNQRLEAALNGVGHDFVMPIREVEKDGEQ